MLAYYPNSTPAIIHKGKNGNIYRLDGFDKCIRIKTILEKDPKFKITNISAGNSEGIAETFIKNTHTNGILNTYKTGKPENLANSSGILWQPSLYTYVVEAAISSIKTVDAALKYKEVSLAIVGGGHHAEKDRPLGFCTINTMALAAIYARDRYHKRVALLDLDTHYGNGCFDILRGEKEVLSTGLWNQKMDKWNYFESGDNIWHRKIRDATNYHKALNQLVKEVTEWKPDFLIYHLGMDVLKTDRMGGVKDFEESDLLERESIVSNLAKSLNTPYIIFLGGAYIDYSKGEEKAEKQKVKVTELQKRALDIHNS